MSIRKGNEIIAKSVLSGNEITDILEDYAKVNALNAETTRAEAAEELISENLANEINRATGSENTLTANIAAETSRAEGVESALTASIAAEVTRATSAESGKANLTLSNITLSNALTNLGFAGQSLTPNGYFKFPNGLIFQWGYSTMNAGSNTTITFPISFPTSCLCVNMTLGASWSYPPVVISKGNSSFVGQQYDGGACYWTAIGY